MEKFTFLGKKVALSAFLCCFSLTGFAQEDTQRNQRVCRILQTTLCH